MDPVGVGGVQSAQRLLGGVVERGVVDPVDPGEVDEARLVDHGHGRPVLHGAVEVVDVDVVAEDPAGVALTLGDGGAGERDEGGVGQGPAQVGGVAVEVVVVAAVGLVGDDDDVASVRQQRVLGARVLLRLGQAELLQGGEVDAAGAPVGELGPQFFAGGDLLRFLG